MCCITFPIFCSFPPLSSVSPRTPALFNAFRNLLGTIQKKIIYSIQQRQSILEVIHASTKKLLTELEERRAGYLDASDHGLIPYLHKSAQSKSVI